jgi:hypothetical protein
MVPNDENYASHRIEINSGARQKSASLQSLVEILYENQNKTNIFKAVICKEPLMMIPVVIYTRKDFYLTDALNEKIENFKAAGLIDFWHFQFIDKNLAKVEESKIPKVLNIEKMIGSFYILLIGFATSFVVFFVELLIKK